MNTNQVASYLNHLLENSPSLHLYFSLETSLGNTHKLNRGKYYGLHGLINQLLIEQGSEEVVAGEYDEGGSLMGFGVVPYRPLD